MNDMKKIWSYALMAVLTVGLSLAATSCKDDDDNNDNNGPSESESGMTIEEIQLSSLINSFAGMQAEEQLAQADWKQKTYQTQVGLVLNESRPTVRTIAVGTVDEADQQAFALLSALGIDLSNPSGFNYSNGEVGTVSYQHGGGSDANTLAVINISVKQLPDISQLQMVKEMPANAGEDWPRYRVGDIIKKDGRLWVCASEASGPGGNAYFVSFFTDHPKDGRSWRGHESDWVYKADKPMASSYTLKQWMKNILLNDENYQGVGAHGLRNSGSALVYQIVPPTEQERQVVIDSLKTGVSDVELRNPVTEPDQTVRFRWTAAPDINGLIIAPRGRLLCDKFRYAMGTTYSYWVPCLAYIDEIGLEAFKGRVNGEPSQNEGSHFQWTYSEKITAKTKYFDVKHKFLPIDHYRIVLTAVYWQHKNYEGNKWFVFDFTKDWANHPKYGAQWRASETKTQWSRCNITSSEMVYADKGKMIDGAQEIYVATVEDERQDGNS